HATPCLPGAVALDYPAASARPVCAVQGEFHRGKSLNAVSDRNVPAPPAGPLSRSRTPLREHVGIAVRRYLRDMGECTDADLYQVALAELEIPLLTEVLAHCDGN